MNSLVPVVDPTAKYSPTRDTDQMADFIDALFAEGWNVEQTGEWAKIVWLLTPMFMWTSLDGARRN